MASLNSLAASVIDALDQPYNFMLKLRAEDAVIGARAMLIRQDYTKLRQVPTYALYEALIPISEEDCGCSGAFTTVGDFPDIIALKDSSPFTFVGTDGRQSISYMLPDEIELYQYNKVSGKLPRYTYFNKRPYLFKIGNLSSILFRAPFADPRQLKKYSCNGESCFSEDDDNFFEEIHRPTIIDVALREMGRKETDDHIVQANGV